MAASNCKGFRHSLATTLITFDDTIVARYYESMIKTFADKRTAAIFEGYQVTRLPKEIQDTARRKLKTIDAATDINSLRVPPGNRLEALKGDRAGQWSIRVNGQWRICFRWIDGDALDVEVADYH